MLQKKQYYSQITALIYQSIQQFLLMDIKQPLLPAQSIQSSDPTLRKQLPPVTFFQLFRFATFSDYFLMIIGAIASIIAGIAIPSFSIFIGNMTNTFSDPDPNQMVAKAQFTMYQFIILGGVTMIMTWIYVACWTIAGERQAIRCRKQYLKRLLSQEIGWFDRVNQTQLATKFNNQTEAFQGALGEKVPVFLSTIGRIIGSICIAYIYGWKMALVVSAYLPFLFAMALFYIYILQNRDKKISQHYEQAGGKAEQAICAIKTVKSLNGQIYQANKFKHSLEKASQKNTKFAFLAGAGFGGMTFAQYSAYALAFWYGGKLIAQRQSNFDGVYDIGTVLTIFLSLVTGGQNLSQISPCIKKFSAGQSAASKIFALIDRVPLIRNPKKGLKPEEIIGIIKFENVKFAYPKEPNKLILNGLNLELRPNQTNALVGSSGCGKSTIMQLIMRFYDPLEGKITLDGTDLRDLDLKWLRQNIGYVGQQPVLFATTIKENLLYGKIGASDDQIYSALKKAEAYEFVTQLQQGLDSYVGTGGGQFSGGQKQRLAIARAILKNPKILLLDEATSALDRKNEILIQETLDKITEDRTTITIAHRVKTIMSADKIFVVEEGKLKEAGKFRQLERFKSIRSIRESTVDENIVKKLENSILKVAQSGELQNYQNVVEAQDSDEQKMENQQGQLNKVKQQNPELQNAQRQKIVQRYRDQAFSRLFKYNRPNLFLFIIGAFMSLGVGAVTPAFSLAISKMVSALIEVQFSGDTKKTNQYAFIIECIAVLAFIFVNIQNSIFIVIGDRFTKRLRLQIFQKIVRMPVSWFDRTENNSGKLASRLSLDCQNVNGLISTVLSINIQVISTLILGIGIAFYNEWRLSLVVLGMLPLIVLSEKIKLAFLTGVNSESDQAYKNSANLIQQATINIRTVTSFGVENSITKKYFDKLEAPLRLATSKGNIAGALLGFSQLVMLTVIAVIFFLAAVFKRRFNVEVSNIFAAFSGIMFASLSLGNNIQNIPDLAAAKNSAVNIFEILDEKDQDQLQNQNQITSYEITKGNIQFRNISFKYPSRIKQVFQDFSIKISAGTKVALVGPSGCGKSTIIQMLLRFYEPDQGSILIDDVDIRKYDVHYLRSIFGLVSQEPVLFCASFQQNIRYNKDNTQFDKIYQVTKEAKALSFIETQENHIENLVPQQKIGFGRSVGVKGSHISGGQKQRVAIARAMLRNPKILLLDQATSALDSKNQKIVQQALDKMMKGRTSVTVAHRIQTIKNSDCIYVFDGGKIIESGSYEELVKMKGQFYRLQRGAN